MRGDCLDEILWQRCNNKTRSSETREGSGKLNSYECQLQERLVTLIATLPDRITGNLQAHARYVLIKYRVTLVKSFSTVVMVGNIRSILNSYLSRKAARIVQHWSLDETGKKLHERQVIYISVS